MPYGRCDISSVVFNYVLIGNFRAEQVRSLPADVRPFPDAVYDRVGNILLSRLMGAEIELVEEGFDIGIRESWEAAIEDVTASGGVPYPIPAGASEHPLGGLGYVGFAEEVRALIALRRTITADDVVLLNDYAYPAYGVPSTETSSAMRLGARLEGMLTDPVYEGKSLQGLIDLVQSDYFPSGSRVLYAHLGGVPAINGYSYLYRNG